jgi:hypothetical protein
MTRFFRNILTFQRIPAGLFFQFFLDFADSGSVTRGYEMFITTLSTVTVMCERHGIPLTEAWPLLRATYSRIFIDEFQQPSQCLCMSALISQRWRSSSSFFVKLLVDIVGEKESFSPNSILTEPVIKSYRIEPLTDLLAALRGCRLPTMTKELVKLLNCPPGHSQLPCAYFSLLPEGLLSTNMHSAFEYFIEYVEHRNATFWALWLKFRPLYTLAFPVGLRANSDTLPVSHIQFLNEAFADLFMRQTRHDKMPLLADCWRLISTYEPFATSIMQDILVRLRHKRLSFTQQFFEWCRPAMSVAPESEFQTFCSILCEYAINDDITNAAPVVAAIFVLFCSRFAKSASAALQIVMCLRLLNFLVAFVEADVRSCSFLVDSYNFMVAKLSKRSLSQEAFFDEARHLFQKLPAEITARLVSNLPLQLMKPAEDGQVVETTRCPVETRQDWDREEMPKDTDGPELDTVLECIMRSWQSEY